MDWSKFAIDWSAAYDTWLRLLKGLLTDPAAPFWWPTLAAALIGAIAAVITTTRDGRTSPAISASLSPYLKELPVDVLCFLGYLFTQALMAPLTLLVTIAGTTLIILAVGVPMPAIQGSPFAVDLGVAALAFVCGDFMLYWSHRLFHWLGPLWAVHRLHHQPPVLTPITAFRFWPPEVAVHLSAFALGEGVAFGVASQFLGMSLNPVRFAGINVFLVAWYIAFSHLRHSPIALQFPRWLSFALVSPHMHQAHHSADPVQHQRNFGTALALWDWMFGTLYIPRAEERFTFGLGRPDSMLDLSNQPV